VVAIDCQKKDSGGRKKPVVERMNESPSEAQLTTVGFVYAFCAHCEKFTSVRKNSKKNRSTQGCVAFFGDLEGLKNGNIGEPPKLPAKRDAIEGGCQLTSMIFKLTSMKDHLPFQDEIPFN